MPVPAADRDVRAPGRWERPVQRKPDCPLLQAVIRPAAMMAAVLTLTACAGQVAVDGAFQPEAGRGGGFGNILVVGVSPDINQRCAFEQAMASSLRQEAVKATTSCSVMTTSAPLTREGVEQAIAAIGADAVLATSLVKAGSSVAVKEGGSADARGAGYYKATGFGYETGYWGAYGVPVVYGEFETAPSVFSISGAVQITSRFFEAGSATLLYVLDTKARNLQSREMALATVTPAISERLRKDGLLQGGAAR